MTKLITIYWRDIPAQVLGRKGRRTVHKMALTPRFQKAIDRAAMRAGRGASDHYLADWRRVATPCDSQLEEAVEKEVARLESLFDEPSLDRLARAGGLASPDGPACSDG